MRVAAHILEAVQIVVGSIKVGRPVIVFLVDGRPAEKCADKAASQGEALADGSTAASVEVIALKGAGFPGSNIVDGLDWRWVIELAKGTTEDGGRCGVLQDFGASSRWRLDRG